MCPMRFLWKWGESEKKEKKSTTCVRLCFCNGSFMKVNILFNWNHILMLKYILLFLSMTFQMFIFTKSSENYKEHYYVWSGWSQLLWQNPEFSLNQNIKAWLLFYVSVNSEEFSILFYWHIFWKLHVGKNPQSEKYNINNIIKKKPNMTVNDLRQTQWHICAFQHL